jgi:dihydroflavonol-4-reductase
VHSLAKSFAGCDVVFHTAAPTQLWSKDKRQIEEPIYQGTLNVITACAQASVRRIIYTSSCAAVGFCATPERDLNESDFNHLTSHPQFRAKLRSEIDGAKLADELDVQLIRVCAPSVVGPGFARATPSVEPYVQLVANKLPAVPNLSYSIVDVRDLADAQIALALGAPDEKRYIVAGHHVTTRALLDILRQVDETLKQPVILPTWVLRWVAMLDAAFYYGSLCRTKRKLTLDLVRDVSGSDQRLSDARFRSEFPLWKPRSLENTIHDTLTYIRGEYAQ